MNSIVKFLNRKTKSTKAESLAEVLVAILVVALAVTLFASMIVSSTTIVNKSRSMMADYNELNTELVVQPNSAKIEAGTVKILSIDGSNFGDTDGNVSLKTSGDDTTVNFFLNDAVPEIEVISYK